MTPHLSLLWAMMLASSSLSGSSLLLPAGGIVLSASAGLAVGKEQDARAEEEAALRRTEAILLKQPGAAPDRLAGIWTRLGWLCLQRQPAEAERLFRKAIDATSKSPPGQPAPAAVRWLGLGWACSTQGKHEEAVKAFREALALHEKAFGRDHVKLIGPLSGLGGTLVNLRQFEQAEAASARIVDIIRRAKEFEDPGLAQRLCDHAYVYRTAERYAMAEALYACVVAILKNAPGNQPAARQALLGDVLASAGYMCRAQGRYLQAEEYHRQALDVRERLEGPAGLGAAQSLNDLGVICLEQGRYAQAEEFLMRSLSAREKATGAASMLLRQNYHNLGMVYMAQRRLGLAETTLRRAAAIEGTSRLGELKRRGVPMDAELETAVRDYGLHELGHVYLMRGQARQAEEIYRRSMAAIELMEGPGNLLAVGCREDLADACLAQGKLREARGLCERALAVREELAGKDHPAVAKALVDLAGLYRAEGDLAAAGRLLDRAMAIFEKAFGQEHLYTAMAALQRAMVAADQGQWELAWSLAPGAQQNLVKARSLAAVSPVTRSTAMARFTVPGLVPFLALKLRKDEDALRLAEQGSALGLRELLALAGAQTTAVLDDDDRRRIEPVLGRINALNNEIASRRQKGRPADDLVKELGRQEMEYDALTAELGKRRSPFVVAQALETMTSDRASACPALDERTAIVGWLAFRECLWGYVIRRDAVRWVNLSDGWNPGGEQQQIRRILESARSSDRQAMPADDLAAVYRGRFALLEPHLAGTDKLIVIAQDWAAYLPVDMLLTRRPAPGERDPADWPWLGRRWEVSAAPSVTVLDLLCRRRSAPSSRWTYELFAMGDPPFSAGQLAQMSAPGDSPNLLSQSAEAPAAVARVLRSDTTAAPPRLPGTRREVQLIAATLGKDRCCVLLGPDASEGKLFEASEAGTLRRCRRVHLATHGLADPQHPELSALLLAMAPAQESFDGVLHMREALRLKLDADLVVLSACQTALGGDVRGEGVVGLSTAFLYAGASSLVISLWNVPDAATTLLMHRFYSDLKAGKSKAAALREAKAWLRTLTPEDLDDLALREPALNGVTRGLGSAVTAPKGRAVSPHPFAHPHNWAGFVLLGDPQ